MRMFPVLVAALLLGLGTAALVAAESVQGSKGDLPVIAPDDQAKPEPAECPIKKTIDGKTYCFQNDPALTKRQGGDHLAD